MGRWARSVGDYPNTIINKVRQKNASDEEEK
jgi:hypothetical protein